MPDAAQITRLLTNRDLDRLARLRLNASRRFTNRSRGEHLAAKGGTSTEFCDFRDYSPGDDVRFVDWNIFARINRPYLKQFHQEEEMHIALLVDASNSMLFEGKFELAQRIAAAIGTLGLRNAEKVGAYVLGNNGARLRPCSGRGGLPKLFSFLENITEGGDQPMDVGIEGFLRQHRGRGAVVILSDFLTQGDIRRSFNLLSSAGLEIFALQILSPGEINPEINGDFRLLDSETESTLDISSGRDLLALYQDYRLRLEQHLSGLCQQRSGHYVNVSTGSPFDQIFFELLRRKGWVK